MTPEHSMGRFGRNVIMGGFLLVVGCGVLEVSNEWLRWMEPLWSSERPFQVTLFTSLSWTFLGAAAALQVSEIRFSLSRKRALLSALCGLTAVFGILSLAIDGQTDWNARVYEWLGLGGPVRPVVIPLLGMVPTFFFLAGVLLQPPVVNDKVALRRLGKLCWLAGTLVVLVLIVSFPLENGYGFWERAGSLSWLSCVVFALFGSFLLAAAACDTWNRWQTEIEVFSQYGKWRRVQFVELWVGAFAALVVLGLVVTGVVYVNRQHRNFVTAKMSQLEALANLKAGQIDQWKVERTSEAVFIMRAPGVARDVHRWLTDRTDQKAKGDVARWLSIMVGSGGRYECISLIDEKGAVLYVTPENASFAAEGLREQVLRTRRTKQIQYGERGQSGADSWRIDMTTPVFDPTSTEENPPVIAVVSFTINPQMQLGRIVRGSPMPSKTAEAVLLRREGDKIVYLSDVFTDAVAGPKRLQVRATEPGLVTSELVERNRSVVSGLDYRGVQVIAFVRKVAGSDWYLMMKEDVDEIHRQTWLQALMVGIVALVLVVAAILGVGFYWRKSSTAMLSTALKTEFERSKIAEQLALLMRHANDIILIADMQGRVVEANERAFEQYGYSREELLRKRLSDLTVPEAAPVFERQLREWQKAGAKVFETDHQRSDGRSFPVEVSGRVVEFGGRKQLMGILRDITKRRDHEREISRLNGLYSALSRINQAAMQSADRQSLFRTVCETLVKNGCFRYVWIGQHNEATKAIELVAQAGSEEGHPILTVDYSDSRPEGFGVTGVAVRENRGDYCNDLQADPRMAPWTQALGGARFRSAAAFPIHLQGKVWGNLSVYSNEVGVFRDKEMDLLGEAAAAVSLAMNDFEGQLVRQAAEASLRESEARFRAVFDAMTESVSLNELVFDGSGKPIDYRIVKCNRTFCEDLRLPMKQVIGRSASELFGSGTVPFLEEFSQVALSGQPQKFEAYSEVSKKHLGISMASPGPGRLVVVAADITFRHEAETAEREREAKFRAELERLVEARTAQLAATNRELEAFSYSVSHDLRAPLRAIDGFARILVADYGERLDSEARRYIGIISKESERMGGLIDDLLAFSRLGRRALKVQETDITMLAKEVYAELMLREKERKVLCEIHDLPNVPVDPNLFRQVWINLIGNALKYTRNRAEAVIEIGGAVQGDEAVCFVKDNGAGFDEKYVNKLFGVFQRLHSDSEFEGNGVGLALVQRIVHRHGGRVWGEGRVDGGATFYVALPLHPHAP